MTWNSGSAARLLAALLALAVAAAGCHGAERPSQQEPRPRANAFADREPAPAGSLAELPAPNELAESAVAAPRAGSAVENQVKLGKEYAMKSGNAEPAGDNLNLLPGEGELSWAIYLFSGIADEDQPLSLTLDLTMLDPTRYFLAFADFRNDTWHWLSAADKRTSATASDVFDVPAGIDAFAPNGQLLAAVAVWDGIEADITQVALEVDVNPEAPVAELQANPNHGNVPFSVTLNAGNSLDRDAGGIADYSWDFDGDGTYDQWGAQAAVSWPYWDIGRHRPVVRVTDTDGLVDTASVNIDAQGWVHTWGSPEYDECRCLAVGREGVLFIAGTAKYYSTSDIWVAKLDRFGRLIWLKSWDSGGADFARAATTDLQGNLYITGSTTLAGDQAVLLLKLNPWGELLYSKAWGISAESCAGHGLDIWDEEYIYLVGETTASGLGEADALLLAFTTDGQALLRAGWGGIDDDIAYDVVTTEDGYICLTGMTASFSGLADLFVMRAGTLLNPYWTRTWHKGLDIGLGVDVDWTGDIYATGSTAVPAEELVLLRLATNGDLIWQKTWSAISFSRGNDIHVISSPMITTRLLIAGRSNLPAGSNSNGLAMEFDSSGAPVSQHSWCTADKAEFFEVDVGSGSAVVFAGGHVNAQGNWQSVTGTLSDAGGAIQSVSGTLVPLSGDAVDVAGTVSEPAFSADSGAGLTDFLAGGVFIEDLDGP